MAYYDYSKEYDPSDLLFDSELISNVPKHIRDQFLPNIVSEYGSQSLTTVDGAIDVSIKVGSTAHQTVPGVFINDMSALFNQFSMMDLGDPMADALIEEMVTQELVVTYSDKSQSVDYDTRSCDYAFLRSPMSEFFVVVNPGAGTMSRIQNSTTHGVYLICGTPGYFESDLYTAAKSRTPHVKFHSVEYINSLDVAAKSTFTIYLAFMGCKTHERSVMFPGFKNVIGWCFNPFNSDNAYCINEISLDDTCVSYSFTRKGYVSSEDWNYDVDYFRYSTSATDVFLNKYSEINAMIKSQTMYILCSARLIPDLDSRYPSYSGYSTSFSPVLCHIINAEESVVVPTVDFGLVLCYTKIVDDVKYVIDIDLPLNSHDRIQLLRRQVSAYPYLDKDFTSYTSRDSDYHFSLPETTDYYRYFVHSKVVSYRTIKYELLINGLIVSFTHLRHHYSKIKKKASVVLIRSSVFSVLRDDVEYIFMLSNLFHKSDLPITYASTLVRHASFLFPRCVDGSEVSLISPFGGYYMVCPPDFHSILNFKVFNFKNAFHYDYTDFIDKTLGVTFVDVDAECDSIV